MTALAEPPVSPVNRASPIGTPGSSALKIVDRGWSVLPLRTGSKVPAIPGGFTKASRDRDLILETWAKRPTLNFGIATGAVSGIVGLDVDGDLGRENLAVLEWTNAPLPSTFQVRTPRGGFHLFFEHPGIEVPNSVNETVGLDVRGDGGYVVGAGSVIDGKPYEVVKDVLPVPLPEWLLERMLAGCLDPAIEPPSRAHADRSTLLTTRLTTALGRGGSEPGRQGHAERVGAGAREASKPAAAAGDRLTDSAAVAKVLDNIGRPGVRFRESATATYSCPLHDHEDVKPSAGLYRSEQGHWRFHCFACDAKLALVELFASVRTGKRISFDGQAPTAARWLLRMWHEAGVDPVEVPDLDVPGVKLTRTERRWAEGFLLLRALRRHVGDLDFSPFTHDFAAAWCGISKRSAERAASKLTGCGWLRIKAAPPGMRCGHLFDLGPVLEQTGNPFESTVAWVVFDADGLAVENRQDRDAVAGQQDIPVGPSGVELESGGAAVDEGHDLLHVAQVRLAERVTGHGQVDASGGPAQPLGLGHGRSLRPTADGPGP